MIIAFIISNILKSEKYKTNRSHFPQLPNNFNQTILGHSHDGIHKTIHPDIYIKFLDNQVKFGGKRVLTIVHNAHDLRSLCHVVLQTGNKWLIEVGFLFLFGEEHQHIGEFCQTVWVFENASVLGIVDYIDERKSFTVHDMVTLYEAFGLFCVDRYDSF